MPRCRGCDSGDISNRLRGARPPWLLIHNDERVTELVIYDLATESEVERVTILDGPGYSTDEWFVHASQTRVALTWSWAEQKEDGQWHYPTASAVYDLGSDPYSTSVRRRRLDRPLTRLRKPVAGSR